MFGKIVRGILVDVVRNTVTVSDLDGSLNDYYRALNCSTIDVVNRRIGGKRYSIYCDDEGLLKEDRTISAVCDEDFHTMLVGNLFICNVDKEGRTISLTESEISNIMAHVRAWYCSRKNCISHVLLAGY